MRKPCAKRIILEIYDVIAEAIRTGEPYRTRLDPPSADLRVAHPPRQRERASEEGRERARERETVGLRRGLC